MRKFNKKTIFTALLVYLYSILAVPAINFRLEHFRSHKSCRFPGHTCHHLIHIVRSCDRSHRPGEKAARVIVVGNPFDRPSICLDGNPGDSSISIHHVCRNLTLRNKRHLSDPHRRVDGRRRDLPIYQIYQRQGTENEVRMIRNIKFRGDRSFSQGTISPSYHPIFYLTWICPNISPMGAAILSSAPTSFAVALLLITTRCFP